MFKEEKEISVIPRTAIAYCPLACVCSPRQILCENSLSCHVPKKLNVFRHVTGLWLLQKPSMFPQDFQRLYPE